MSTITERTGPAPNIHMSHVELLVRDVDAMLAFYTTTLGFVITDRASGPDGMVFLSRSSDEHHQLVLNPVADNGLPRRLDHLAFRVDSLSDLRVFQRRLTDVRHDTVTHGTTWSLYFTDPEGNRLEVFTLTPWHVDQPVRLPVDLDADDDALVQVTRGLIEDLTGFEPRSDWHLRHRADLGSV